MVKVTCNCRYEGMRGCMGAAKEMIYGTFFLVRFKTAGVKLEDGLDIKISVKIRSRDMEPTVKIIIFKLQNILSAGILTCPKAIKKS